MSCAHNLKANIESAATEKRFKAGSFRLFSSLFPSFLFFFLFSGLPLFKGCNFFLVLVCRFDKPHSGQTSGHQEVGGRVPCRSLIVTNGKEGSQHLSCHFFCCSQARSRCPICALSMIYRAGEKGKKESERERGGLPGERGGRRWVRRVRVGKGK